MQKAIDTIEVVESIEEIEEAQPIITTSVDYKIDNLKTYGEVEPTFSIDANGKLNIKFSRPVYFP